VDGPCSRRGGAGFLRIENGVVGSKGRYWEMYRRYSAAVRS
jgi:hypothetical protein